MSDFEHDKQLAQALHGSRLFRTPSWEVALAVIQYGREIGLGPASALLNVQIVQGKPTLGAAAVGALLKRSGRFDYRVTALDDQHAAIEFSERREGKWTAIGTSTFSLDDARRANLGSTPTWKSYPRNLLLARAMTNGVRWFCPSVTLGTVYDPEELYDSAAQDAGDVPVPDPSMAPTNGTPSAPTITLDGLVAGFGADAVYAAAGGTLPTTDDDLKAVAEKLAATTPTVGADEALAEAEPPT